MKQRTITGLALTAFLAVMLWLPGWCMAIAVMVCVSLAMYEEMQALKKAGHRIVIWPTWAAMALSIPLTYFLSQKIMIPLVAAAFLAMCVQVLFREEPELTDLEMSSLPLVTVALPGLSLVTLSLIDPYAWHTPDNPLPLHAVEVVILTLTFAIRRPGRQRAGRGNHLSNDSVALQRGDAELSAGMVDVSAAGPAGRFRWPDGGPVRFPGEAALRTEGFFKHLSGPRRDAGPAGQRVVHGGADVLLPAVLYDSIIF